MSISFNDLDPPIRAYRYTSIRSCLILLVGGVLVPMLALAVTMSWYYVVAARATIAAQRLDVANNLNNLVEREIGSLAGFLEGLAASRGVLEDQRDAIQMAMHMAQARGFESIAVFNSDGRLQAASSTGTPRAFPAAEQIGIKHALSRGRMVVSELQRDHGTPYLFFVSVPVSLNGQPTVIVSGGVAASRLQGLFAEAGLREGWRADIADQAGTIVARSREPETFVGRAAQRRIADAGRDVPSSGLFDVVSRDGMEVSGSFRRSPSTGWTVGVAVPALIERAPYWITSLGIGALVVSLVLLGLILAISVASRITAAVHAIERAVVALATNEAVPIPTRTLLEFRDVWHLIESLSAGRSKGIYRVGEGTWADEAAVSLIPSHSQSGRPSKRAFLQGHLSIGHFVLVLAVMVIAVVWMISP